MTDRRVKRHYARRFFCLPIGQVRYFGELNEAQVEEVRKYFSSGLVNVEQYVYAVRRDGRLVWQRERRDLLMEAAKEV